MLFRPSCLAALLATAVSLSCGDPTAPRGEPGINFVAGADGSDTTFAVLTQALVVEVRDSTGRRVPAGTIVRFQGAVSDFVNETTVGKLTESPFFSLVAVETDQEGRAASLVRLGPRAGVARVVVTVPTLGMTDTAHYSVLPGNPFSILLSPSDTTLYVGGSYSLSAVVRDMWGNERDDEIHFMNGTGITVSNSGQVTAIAVGRYAITATVGTLSRNADVSVVPQFRLVAWQTFPTQSIVSMNLDGSDKKVLASVVDGGIGAHPQWIPGTATAIYSTLDGGIQRLRVVGENGVSSAFMSPTPAGIAHQAEPAPTADGNWMFFSAFNDACNTGDYCVNRATPSGGSPTALETVGVPSRQPAPSPDGSLVAFVRDPFFTIIQVMNTAGEVQDWAVTGSRPSWSPQGNKIAYVNDGRLWTINADGNGQTPVSPPGTGGWGGPIRWSPDGAWIVARNNDVLALLQVATGVILPLPGTTSMHGGSLR